MRECKSLYKYKKCQMPHHTLLHIESQCDTTLTPNSPEPVSSNAAAGPTSNSLLICSPCAPLWRLDSGSSASFVWERDCLSLSLSLKYHYSCYHWYFSQLSNPISIFHPRMTTQRKLSMTTVKVCCDIPSNLVWHQLEAHTSVIRTLRVLYDTCDLWHIGFLIRCQHLKHSLDFSSEFLLPQMSWITHSMSMIACLVPTHLWQSKYINSCWSCSTEVGFKWNSSGKNIMQHLRYSQSTCIIQGFNEVANFEIKLLHVGSSNPLESVQQCPQICQIQSSYFIFAKPTTFVDGIPEIFDNTADFPNTKILLFDLYRMNGSAVLDLTVPWNHPPSGSIYYLLPQRLLHLW